MYSLEYVYCLGRCILEYVYCLGLCSLEYVYCLGLYSLEYVYCLGLCSLEYVYCQYLRPTRSKSDLPGCCSLISMVSIALSIKILYFSIV